MTRNPVYQAEYDDFKRALSDLCTAVNRPFNDDLARVFWEDLKPVSLVDIKRQCLAMRAEGKSRFTSSDLRPAARPMSTFEPSTEIFDKFHRLGQLALLNCLKSNGAASEESLSKLIAAKNEIVNSARSDPATDLKELEGVLKAAFRRLWQPMPSSQQEWHLDHYRRTGRVFDPR